jgi:hypothetical protein
MDRRVKSLLVTFLMGVAFWLGMASQVRPAPIHFYRPAPPEPTKAVLQVPLGECKEIKRLRERMDKIRGKE